MERAPELCESCEAKLRKAAKRLTGMKGNETDVTYLQIPEDPRIPLALRVISGDGRDHDFGEAFLTEMEVDA